MSRILTISDQLYGKLEAAANRQGFENVEKLLETWQTDDDQDDQRISIVRRIDSLHQRLLATYGEMSDSTPLLREDRMR